MLSASRIVIVPSAFVLALLASVGPARAQLVINELEYDQNATDNAEFIELANVGSGPVDLSSYSLVFVNGGVAPPAVYRTILLGPGTLAPGAYYVVCANSGSVARCDLDAAPNTDLIQNGPTDAVGLRQGALDVDRLSYEGSVVGFTEGSGAAADTGAIAAEGLSRCPDSTDTDNNASDFQLKSNTPGVANACDSRDGGGLPLGACGEPATPIGALQGTGATSPISGAAVVIEGVVVGDFRVSMNGFFVQEEDTDADGDPDSSDGVFIFPGAQTVPVSTGALVRVSGTVAELDGITELSSVRGIVVCPGTPPASARTLTFPVASVADLERYEGMLVQIPQTLTVTGNFELGRFGSLDLAVGGRLYQPTQRVPKGAAALALQAENDRRRIVLDDANAGQNPNPVPYKDGNGTRRVGDTLPSLTGIVDQRFGSYRLQPTVPPSFTASNPRPLAPSVPGRLHVAACNVLNYFTTLDDGQPHCTPAGTQNCRGANTPAELTRQRTKVLNALRGLDGDIVGLLEVENNPSAAVQDLVDGLNAALGAETYAFVDTGTVGTDAIKVALLYKTTQVGLLGSFALLTSSVDPRFLDSKNRPVLAQTFVERATGARFTVALNHWKSKGSDCNDVGDPDLGDGQANCNLTRTAAARAVIDWLASDPTHSGDPDNLLIGDFNAYAKEDPIASLVAGGYESLVASFVGASAYSYQFHGQSGYLDHAFASTSLSGQVAGVSEWHNNADEPTVLDYNTEFKTDDLYSASDAYRASDHDPLVVGLDLSAPTSTVNMNDLRSRVSP